MLKVLGNMYRIRSKSTWVALGLYPAVVTLAYLDNKGKVSAALFTVAVITGPAFFIPIAGAIDIAFLWAGKKMDHLFGGIMTKGRHED